MTKALLLALLVLLPTAAGQARTIGGTPIAFVSAETDSQLVAVDVTSRRVLGRIAVPPGPHNVAVAYRRRPLVLVTSPPAGKVTVVDARSRRIVRTLGGFGYPHDVEVQGKWAYLTDEARGQLVVIDLDALRVVRRIAVGPRPHDLAVSPDQPTVWVTHDPPGGITIVDVARSRVVGSAGGARTHDIAFGRAGRLVWVTYWNSGAVGAIDAQAHRLRLRRTLGRLIHHVQVDPARPGGIVATDHATGRSFLLSSSGRVVRRFSGCAGAHHADFVGDVKIVVACHDSASLALYDPRTGRRSLVRVGRGPHGVAVAVL